MKSSHIRVLTSSVCFLLAFLWGCLSAGFYASAVEPKYSVSENYRNSSYYNSLLEIKLGDDQRQNVIDIALSQAGYHEGDSESELDGSNKAGKGNFVEYNRYYGKMGDSYSYAWCGSFIWWCMMHAGISESIYRPSLSCSKMISFFRDKNRLHGRDSGYVPIGGDIVFFANTNSGMPSFFGLVVSVTPEWIFTVEGDGDNCVNIRRYRKSDSYIYAYGAPDYTSSPGRYDFIPELTDNRVGSYAVRVAKTTVYTEYDGSIELVSVVDGEILEILSIVGNRGRIDVAGKTGFVNLSDLSPVGPDLTEPFPTDTATPETFPEPESDTSNGLDDFENTKVWEESEDDFLDENTEPIITNEPKEEYDDQIKINGEGIYSVLVLLGITVLITSVSVLLSKVNSDK